MRRGTVKRPPEQGPSARTAFFADTTALILFFTTTGIISIALVSFQVPIYAAIIAFSGASGAGLVRGTLGAALMMLCLGRPYGAFLNGVRKLFGLPAGGNKPMSLNG
jgi:hypothetical protein